MGSTNDLDSLFDYGVSFRKRAVYLSGSDKEDNAVDSHMAENAIKGLIMLDKPDSEITVYIHTVGGSVYAGWAIYDAIQACQSHVTTVVLGNAFSMGAILLQAGDRRLIAPNADLMVHYGYSGDGFDRIDTKRASQAYNELLIRRTEEMFLARVRAKIPGFPRRNLKRWLKDDRYFTAEEAIEYGLADGFYTGSIA